MSKRKARSRRHDPRSMTREQYIAERLKRCHTPHERGVLEYAIKHGDSPYTAIERLRYR